jgi:hypothetical protein
LILHLVLFTPRVDLGAAERAAIRDSLHRALTEIPSIRDYKIGRRVRLGTTYDRVAPLDFEFLVTIEFEDEQALREYLAHPAHQQLGELFYETSSQALACDFKAATVSDLH